MVTSDGVWFEVPETFVPLDLGDDPDERVRRIVAGTPTLEKAMQLEVIARQEVAVELLRRSSVGYAATVVCWVDEQRPRLATAHFTVAAPETAVGPRVLESVVEHLDWPRCRAQSVDLPAGRGALVALTDDSGGASTYTHQLFLPFPHRRRLAVVALATASVEFAELCSELLLRIGRSLSFTAPGGTVSAVLDAS